MVLSMVQRPQEIGRPSQRPDLPDGRSEVAENLWQHMPGGVAGATQSQPKNTKIRFKGVGFFFI
jgi:hypothetical protein